MGKKDSVAGQAHYGHWSSDPGSSRPDALCRLPTIATPWEPNKELEPLARGVVRAGEALVLLTHYLQGAYVTDVDILLKQRWANC
jgi:hypothetical protein